MSCIEKLMTIGMLNIQDTFQNQLKILKNMLKIWQDFMGEVLIYSRKKTMSHKFNRQGRLQAKNKKEENPRDLFKSLFKKLRCH
jgi:hypothetical protein